MRPGTDGIERLSKMQTAMEARSISVIIATAKGQEYDRIRGLDLGAKVGSLWSPHNEPHFVECKAGFIIYCAISLKKPKTML